MKKLETVIKDLKRSLENVKEYPERGIITMPPQDARMLLNAIEEALEKNEKSEPTADLPAPNTVMWWLCRIADPEIRRKAVFARIHHSFKTPKAEFQVDFTNALDNGINWSLTGEYSYWQTLSRNNPSLLPSPEWKEYLEILK